jgi:hypothetical protein
MRLRKDLLRRSRPGEERRREAEQLAARFLEGMESPPSARGTPHWDAPVSDS